MAKSKLKGKDLKKIGYVSNKAISIAIDLVAKQYKHSSKVEQLELLKNIKENYEEYLEDTVLGLLAQEFLPEITTEKRKQIELFSEPISFNTIGSKLIAENTFKQMELAMQLPITRKGALMPDAHQGYGLPIGGVLATENSVIPYGVGLDIGCRMSLSIYDLKASYLDRYLFQIQTALKSKTNFGTGGELNLVQDHQILDDPRFGNTSLLKKLHGKAVKQLGTSGSGNHFVEFGLVQVDDGNDWGIEPGEYVGLLSHSGSRGFGASIAKEYTTIAKEKCLLPRHAGHLAWLGLDTQEGQEYWLSMNLAGDYAKACHDQIHYNLEKHLGLEPIAKVENHHNFAWKEKQSNGQELIVHRKGATPAAKGELGIIPGSMATSGYIVRGLGNEASLNSASHGAGRKMSRKAIKESYTGSALRKVLACNKVTLIGGGVDEAPVAYKDIEEVVKAQQNLIEVIGKFTPRIVRMDKH